MTEQAYRDLANIANSDLKILSEDPMLFYKQKILKTEKGFGGNTDTEFGSLLDDYICDKQKYLRTYISYAGKVSSTLQEIIKTIYQHVVSFYCNPEHVSYIGKAVHEIDFTEIDFELFGLKSLVIQTAREAKYQPNYKDDTLYSNIINTGYDYYKILVDNPTKKLVAVETLAEAETLVEQTKQGELNQTYGKLAQLLRWLHKDDPIPAAIELKTQYIITDVVTSVYSEDVPLKGKLDLQIINHSLKTIKTVDFKKAVDAQQFAKSYRNYGYARQVRFYDYLAGATMQDEKTIGYTVTDPLFAVFYQQGHIRSELIQPSKEDYENGLKGRAAIKGYLPLLNEYVFRKKNNVWTGTFNYASDIENASVSQIRVLNIS